jgi:RNA polymerase sigma-70 factor (ECF subfamily)
MSFEEVYDKYFARIYNYIRYRVIERDAADDLVSAVFEKVLDKYGSFDPAKAPLEPWLFAIARNTLNDHFRRRKVRGWLSITDREENIASAESVEGAAQKSETDALLLAAVARLEDQERELIAMKFTLGLNNREIAGQTGLGESNVGVILFRAMKKLRELLGPESI